MNSEISDSTKKALTLVERSNWTNRDVEYLKNTRITEYDLHSGGLSVITEYGLLKPDIIAKLCAMEKKPKNIAIGKLQIKHPELAKKMVDGFTEARKLFVTVNSISDFQILSIKKDALFVINPGNIKTQLTENLDFREKSTYTSYAQINGKEFLYDPKDANLTIKGFSEEVVDKQKDFLFKDFRYFLSVAERVDKVELFKILRKYENDYLRKKLPIDTYRRVDSGQFILFSGFNLDEIDHERLAETDISYNYINYVLPFIGYLMRSFR